MNIERTKTDLDILFKSRIIEGDPDMKLLRLPISIAIIAIIISALFAITPWSNSEPVRQDGQDGSLSVIPLPDEMTPDSGRLPAPVIFEPFGVTVEGVEYRYARAEALPEEIKTYRVTVYGPPLFTAGDPVARGNMSVAEGREWATRLHLDGIAACSPDTEFYYRIRDEMPPIIHVEGKGRFLMIDRTNARLHNTIDLYVDDPWPGGTYFCDEIKVWEIVAGEF